MQSNFFERLEQEATPFTVYGQVTSVQKHFLRVQIPKAKIGGLIKIVGRDKQLAFEVVSMGLDGAVAMPLDSTEGVEIGDKVQLENVESTLSVGTNFLGQVVDSCGISLTNGKKIEGDKLQPLFARYTNPLNRKVINQPLNLGVRCIDAFVPCGRGQRLGIFAGSGVGKSVLMGMMARYTQADVVVVALIGERGREVNEFIQHELGEEGLKKSVIVVETAEQSALRRTRAAFAATAVAEYFKDRGCHVLLLMDSLTRFAMAQREIGLASKEMPTSKGYTPSVFIALSQLLERAGNFSDQSSITGLYTVLVEGDDFEDPIADSTRAVLDGHIVLSRDLAHRGQYPAVDVLKSVSRVADQILPKEKIQSVRMLKQHLNRYYQNEDAIHYGLYQRGTDLELDKSIELEPRIHQFLKQERDEAIDASLLWQQVKDLARES